MAKNNLMIYVSPLNLFVGGVTLTSLGSAAFVGSFLPQSVLVAIMPWAALATAVGGVMLLAGKK